MQWFRGPTKGPSSLVSPAVTNFTAPKSRTSLRIFSFGYEGHGGINKAIAPAQVGSFTAVFAPRDLAALGVLSDARNRVGF